LHLNHDPKQLKEENLDKMTKEELHALCKALELPRSGNRQTLLIRVAGVLSAQHKNWGTIKRSLKRRGGSVEIPSPGDSDDVQETESPSIEKAVETFVTEHPEGWSFEQESELIETIEETQLETSLADVATSIEESLLHTLQSSSNLFRQCSKNYQQKNLHLRKRLLCWKFLLVVQR
jgi:hypothetical protein